MFNNRLRFSFFALFIFFISIFIWVSCSTKTPVQEKYVRRDRKVEIVKEGNSFVLYRNGKPYFIKGAAGYDYYDRLAQYGGNSIRVWHTDDAQKILDEAQKNGLTVTLGLWMAREREGFNYYDKESVAEQLEELKQVVVKFKDHPALLMWGIGNELYADGSNVKVWDAVNGVAEMIHEVDPDHPTTTTIMNVPDKVVNLIVDRCPALDVLSINSFGGLNSLGDEIAKTDWTGPYIVSEFGARGYWESYYTWWMAPIEQTSSEKAEFAKQRYQKSVLDNQDKCLGSYVFLWGSKQETTGTWFSLFHKKGEETELVHVMQEMWTGRESKNRSPYIAFVTLDQKYAFDHIYLKPEQTYQSKVFTFDPDQDSLQLEWQLLPEVEAADGNTGKQVEPAPITGQLHATGASNEILLKTPEKEGAYRLFVYVRDGKNNIATANVPFFVTQHPLH
ncbi:glycoside hydrolase family 2 TIM barrel-domain containing protein [Pontibacter sp. MBLB2868]|uniref:glycoside hydrolase family 2 TIM barrel-domain containing protein n=1 Tax=Pontibacter sp. MBLB2868 TaxID=3451555 RepID=UPI003F752364